jgi:SAM-dependent methyltransferase
MQGMTAHRESDEWLETFDNETGIERRKNAIDAKLRKLGMDKIPREAAVLDLCCGRCESLEALHRQGFRHLSGIDIFIPEQLIADERFALKIGDACNSGLEAESQDWILVLHALHHMENAATVGRLVSEAWRLLKPGGRLSIIDFANSPQIRTAFWFFRRDVFLITPYLKWYGKLVQEEWPYLKDYLPQFSEVWNLLHDGPFEVETERRELFLFFLTLRKPGDAAASEPLAVAP